MKVLFDVTHPAHVHLFKNAIHELRTDGHEVRVTSREKDLTTQLLDAYGIDHTPISAKGETKPELITEWIGREFRMLATTLSFDPDVIVGRLNPPAAHASAVTGAPSIIMDDSEEARFPALITHPFSDSICTPASYDGDLGSKQTSYDGFHELAYLHPDQFEPDPSVLEEHGIDPGDTFSVLRFVSWGAHHDVGQSGLSLAGKRELVDVLSEYGDVYITSEGDLPAEFADHQLPIPPEDIHHLLSFADLYVGDSQTMATEAALLGTPAIRSNSFAGDGDMGNFAALERHGLLLSTNDEREAIATAREWLENPELGAEWEARRDHFLDDKIDVTEFILGQIRRAAG